MEELRIVVDAPDQGWPLVITIECGGYASQLVLVACNEQVPWRRTEFGARLGRVVEAWVAGGALEAQAELRRQTALSDARRGR